MTQEKTPLKDGIHFGLDEMKYHGDTALGASGICDLLVGPQVYWRNSPHNPDREEEDTPATALGKWFHRLCSGDTVNCVVKPEGMSFATNAGKAWRDENEGKTIIAANVDKAARTMLAALEQSGAIADHSDFLSEVTYVWTGKDGIRRKIRIDRLCPDSAIDFKTFSNSQSKDAETALAHAVAYGRYHIKGAWYGAGIAHMLDMMERKRISYHGQIDDPTNQRIAIASGAAEVFRIWYVFVESNPVPAIYKRSFAKYSADGQINGYWKKAIFEIELALHQYKQFSKSHGFDRPWIPEVHAKSFADEDFEAARWIVERE